MNKNKFKYPIAPSKPVTEDYFGTKITDHYRNLENLEDPTVQAWIKAQAIYAEDFLKNIPGREALIQKMEDFAQRQTFKVSRINVTNDDQFFFLKQEKGAETAQVFYRKNVSGEDELLFDPKEYKPETEKKHVISNICPSWDGQYLVIGISHSGSEISEMIILDMKTRKVLPQIITHCYPSVTWFPNNKGFAYLHRPVIDINSFDAHKNTKMVRYYIGDDSKDLNVIFSKETHPELKIAAEDYMYIYLFDSLDKYIFGYVSRSASFYNEVYYTTIEELEHGIPDWKPILTVDDQSRYGCLINDNYVFQTVKNAPNVQIRSISIGKETVGESKLLVDAQEDTVIDDFAGTSEGLYFTRLKNGVESKLYLLKEGKEIAIPMPNPVGNIKLSSKGGAYAELRIIATGWLSNSIRYKYQNNQFTEESFESKAQFPEFDNFVVKELLVPSHDGVQVPLSVIHQKGIDLNGKHPTIIGAYGSYGLSKYPRFSPKSLTWVAEGGIYCIAHIRGGGEKGEEWYEAGKKVNKPNSWKDLIACTEYLIEKGYTSKQHTAIWGNSAGGILVGRAMTERPDLFATVISNVGAMNMLRSENAPNGLNNIKEFGTVKNPEECKALIEMDAYLHIEKDVDYPATLITAGVNDPRIIVWQPGKFAAKLQVNNASNKPIIFLVDYESGHGIGSTESQVMKRFANMYSFAFWQLKHPLTQN